MKHILIIIIAALLLVGCATTQSLGHPLFDAIKKGDIEAVRQYLDTDADVNERIRVKPSGLALLTPDGTLGRTMLGLSPKVTPLDFAISTKNPQTSGLLRKASHPEIADLLRKCGGKTSLELKHVWIQP